MAKDSGKPSKELIKGFYKISTATISDALDRFGIKGGCLGILPVVTGLKAVGPAFTVKYVPVGVVKGTVGDYIDIAQPGDIIVLDNEGRNWCTVWGDILTVVAKHKGIAGTVIDGVCRDVHRIIELKYPIYTKGRFMMTGKDRVQVDGVNVTVSLSDVQVKPGDIVVADDSGVVVVPLEKAEEVLAAAREIDDMEDKIEKEVLSGKTIAEARTRYKYHVLQRDK